MLLITVTAAWILFASASLLWRSWRLPEVWHSSLAWSPMALLAFVELWLLYRCEHAQQQRERSGQSKTSLWSQRAYCCACFAGQSRIESRLYVPQRSFAHLLGPKLTGIHQSNRNIVATCEGEDAIAFLGSSPKPFRQTLFDPRLGRSGFSLELPYRSWPNTLFPAAPAMNSVRRG
jgi:hypothetical protein